MNDASVRPPDVIIPDIMRNFFDRMKEPYSVVNEESRYVYANLALAKLAGLNSPDRLIGKLYNEVQAKLFESEERNKIWKHQDDQVRSGNGRNLKMLEVHPRATCSPYTIEKYPLLDTQKIVGVVHHNRYVEILKPNDFLRGKKPGSLLLIKPDDTFTEKECEIIFLKIQGMTSKKIADILNLSSRTVDNRMQNIYFKSDTANLDDLEGFCERTGLDRYLPEKFINSQQIMF